MDDSRCIYQIRIAGELDEQWSDWFSGITVAIDDGPRKVTLLTGAADQAALRGILNKVWDLNLVLISVNPVENRS